MARKVKTYASEYDRGAKCAEQTIEEWLESDSLPGDWLDRHLDVARKCAASPTKSYVEQGFHQGFADRLESAMGMVEAILDTVELEGE